MRIQETPKQAARRFSKAYIAKGFEPQALHEYKDENGAILYWKIRLKHPNGKKQFFYMYQDESEQYHLKAPPTLAGKRKPLYGLHLLTIHSHAIAYIVEGELKANALNRFFTEYNVNEKYIATTSGGATSADEAEWQSLINRQTVLWPDNDDSGRAYIKSVSEKLIAINCDTRLIDINTLGLPEKGDCVDWLQANPSATLEELLAIPTIIIESTKQEDALKNNDKWRTPSPIQAPLHPVPAFDPSALLPPLLRDWVINEADRMPCAPDFIAAGLIVSLGSVIGTRCGIRPKSQDSWVIIPNLWGGIVAPPSAKKSPAINIALEPLNALAQKASESHRIATEEFSSQKTIHEAKCRAYKKKIEDAAKKSIIGEISDLETIVNGFQKFEQEAPIAPIKRRFKTNDCTVEKLGELLQENPNGLLVTRDELVGLLSTWDRLGHEGDRAFFLEGWNGNSSFNTDRIGRGCISIPNLCISVFGGIQPEKLIGYLEQASNSLANDGLLQRFQVLVYPDNPQWEWRDSKPEYGLREQLVTLFKTLSEADLIKFGANLPDANSRFPYFQFSQEAQQIFIDWSRDLHTQRIETEEQSIIQQHLAKYDKLFPAIALILHLVECATTGANGPISADTAYRAAAWCEYLEAHARRCYGLLIDDGLRSAQALAEKIRANKLADGFTLRDIRQKQWRYLTNDNAIEAAIDWLEDAGWLFAIESGGTGPGSGRPTTRYLINSALKDMHKDEGGND